MSRVKRNSKHKKMTSLLHVLKMRMCNSALHFSKTIDIRSLRVLQRLHLLKIKAGSSDDDIEISILQNPTHPLRRALPAGPLLLYNNKDDASKVTVVEIPVLLLSGNKYIRKEALELLRQLVLTKTFTGTQRTRNILNAQNDLLVTDDYSKWIQTAILLYDVVTDDFLISLHGLRQSISSDPVIQASLNNYAPKVLRPTLSSLDTILLDVMNPESEHDKISNRINKIVAESRTLADACSEYYLKLGYLPFAPKYSMLMIVKGWLDIHPGVEAWTEIWNWVETTPGPIPKYHACFVFAQCPELIPAEKTSSLWSEILKVVSANVNVTDVELAHCDWLLRLELSRHYSYHLETIIPDSKGDVIRCIAWWLSERVASIFPENPQSAKYYLDRWVEPSLELSRSIWYSASPQTQATFLRYITYALYSPWALSLLSVMSSKLEILRLKEQSVETQAQIINSLLWHLIFSMPFPVNDTSSDPTLSLEIFSENNISRYTDYISVEQQKDFDRLIQMSRELNTGDGLRNALQNLKEASVTEQLSISLAIKAKAYIDPQMSDIIWDVLSQEKWRREILCSVDINILLLLFETFSILQIQTRDKWFYILPHYVADICDTVEDDEKRRLLFNYVLRTSLSADNVGAVRRLLQGTNKGKYLAYIQIFIDRYEELRSLYPPHVVGKMRALIANLRIV